MLKFREHRRLAADFNTTCRSPAALQVVSITDVSKTGCAVSSSNLRQGETIILELPQVGHVSGQVVWADSREGGIKFTRELDDWEIALVASGMNSNIHAVLGDVAPAQQDVGPL